MRTSSVIVLACAIVIASLPWAAVAQEALAAGVPVTRVVTAGSPLTFNFAFGSEGSGTLAVLVGSCDSGSLTLAVDGVLGPQKEFTDFFIEKTTTATGTATMNVSTTSATATFTIVLTSKAAVHTLTTIPETSSVLLLPHTAISSNFTAMESFYKYSNGTCTTQTPAIRTIGLPASAAVELTGFDNNQTVLVAAFGVDSDGMLQIFPPSSTQTQILSCSVPSGLSFCDVEYAVPGNQSAYLAADQNALQQYNSALQVLSQYNCVDDQIRYSFIVTCSDCRAAYKAWLCRKSFDKCATYVAQPTLKDNRQYIELPCWGTCVKAMQTCPYYLGFQCPLDQQYESFFRSYMMCPGDDGVSPAWHVMPQWPLLMVALTIVVFVFRLQ